MFAKTFHLTVNSHTVCEQLWNSITTITTVLDEETNVQDIFYINNADTFGQSTGELQLKARPDVDAQYTVRLLLH